MSDWLRVVDIGIGGDQFVQVGSDSPVRGVPVAVEIKCRVTGDISVLKHCGLVDGRVVNCHLGLAFEAVCFDEQTLLFASSDCAVGSLRASD